MALTSDLLSPIPGDNPAGADLRYDPLYDKIKEARREDDDLPAGDWATTRKTAEWPVVIRLTTEALSKRSKDLQLAAWLCEALLRRDGFGGLREGLGVITSLLSDYWDTLYPALDEDGDSAMRAAPLAWLGLKLDIPIKQAPFTTSGYSYLDYLDSETIPDEAAVEEDYEGNKRKVREAAVAAGRVTPEAFEKAFAGTPKEWYRTLVGDIRACAEAVEGLDRHADELLGDNAPSFRVLKDVLDEVGRGAQQLLSRKLEIEPDPIAAVPQEVVLADVSPVAGGGVAASVPNVAGGGVGTLTPTPTSVEDASARITAAARFLRAADPTNPAPYLLLRGYRWGELRAGGGALDPKLLAAPPTDVRVRLKMLLLDRKWSALLDAAEDVMASPYGRGWLDLQRHTLTACEALGSDYESVARAIRGALRSLLEDLPTLPELTLMDDSPTANAETLRWLEAGGFLAPGAARGEVEAERPTTRAGEPRDRAHDFVRAGAPGKGIEYLMQEASRSKSARGRFLRRMEATGIMVETGLDAVARPILEELVSQIERFKLEEWEAGEVVAEPLGLLYRCLARTGEDPTVEQELYLKICRLDPIHAMSLRDGDTAQGSQE